MCVCLWEKAKDSSGITFSHASVIAYNKKYLMQYLSLEFFFFALSKNK